MTDLYERMARFLDELPAGFPRTASGVELRILRKLFSPEEAQLFLHLTLIGEEPHVVAHRAGLPVDQAARMLDEMEMKGLVSGSHEPGKPVEYSAQQFVIGFWEGQVNRLDRELVDLFEAYLPDLFDANTWRKSPQLRTIPVGESIPVKTLVMAYERAEEIVRSKTQIAIMNCICRQERRLEGKGCTRPLESCMTFDSAARTSVASGKARFITTGEALAILKQADQAGLVLQPTNAQDPLSICACCGCCCGVLRSLKRQEKPASIASSPFHAQQDSDTCLGCGACLDRCPMDAITLPDGTAVVDLDRCIGCGLCVSACPSGALTLVRKPASDQPPVPKKVAFTYIKLGLARGKMTPGSLVSLLVKSKVDRLVARRGH